MTARDRFVKAVRVWLADEAYRKDDRYKIKNVDYHYRLAYQLERANCEDANVEQEHRYPYADCRCIPYDIDRDERLFLINEIQMDRKSSQVAHLCCKARFS